MKMLLLAVIFTVLSGAGLTCATEDSSMCVWFGPFQGNMRGNVVVNGDLR